MQLRSISLTAYRADFPRIPTAATREKDVKIALDPHLLSLVGAPAVRVGGGGFERFDWVLRRNDGQFVLVEAKRKLTRASVATKQPIAKKLDTVVEWTQGNEDTWALLTRRSARRASRPTQGGWSLGTPAQIAAALGRPWADLPCGLAPLVIVVAAEVSSGGLAALQVARRSASVRDLRVWVLRPDRTSEDVLHLSDWETS
jgi:hypothetical protein